MTPDVRHLFASLAALPPEARAVELDRLNLAPELRQEVEQLLAADLLTDNLIEGPIRDAASRLASSTASLRLGPWRTTGLLGQGGMGVVYRAERADGTVEQLAAIKLLYRGFETDDLLARFQRERSILARLSHPNIARFLDAGATPDGLPWFAMEFVDGKPLDQYCDQQQLSAQARVSLFLQVCAAVQHAHSHLIIHRDIKPDNILVTPDGTPILLDFGIAQILSETRPGAPVTRAMTPGYASPEQLSGGATTTATDVYLLGAVLRRLLADPSTGDTANIIRRAMHEDPARRYATPAALAADLTAWLNGQPVAATPDTVLYRSGRFVARHPWPVAIAVFAFLATAVSAGIALQQARNARRQFRDVRALANVFLFDFEAAISNLDGATKARELVVATAQKYLGSLSAQDSGDPELQRELAEAWEKLGRIQGGQTTANLGRRDDAINSFRKSLELRRRLGDDRTLNAERRRAWLEASSNLVGALMYQQKGAEAMAISKASVANADAMLRDLPASKETARSVFQTHMSHSVLCLRQSDSACALTSGERALSVIRAWADAHPAELRIELDIAKGELSVAQTAIFYADYRRGRATAKSMTERIEKIERNWPGIAESRRLGLLAWQLFGAALGASSPGLPAAPEQAVVALRKAVALATAIRNKDPNNILATEDLIIAKETLGSVLADAGRPEAADVLAPLRAEVTAFLAKHPDDPNMKTTLADTNNDLGKALRQAGQPEAALKGHLAAMAIVDSILATSPEDAVCLKIRSIALVRAAHAEMDLKRFDAALSHLDQAQQTLAVALKNAPADTMLVDLNAEAGRLREEIRKKVR